MTMAEKETNIILELLTALGNLFFKNDLNVSIAKDMDVNATVEAVKLDNEDEDDIKDIIALQKYVSQLLK